MPRPAMPRQPCLASLAMPCLLQTFRHGSRRGQGFNDHGEFPRFIIGCFVFFSQVLQFFERLSNTYQFPAQFTQRRQILPRASENCIDMLIVLLPLASLWFNIYVDE